MNPQSFSAGQIAVPKNNFYSGVTLPSQSGMSPELTNLLKSNTQTPQVSAPTAPTATPQATGTFGGTAALPTQYSYNNGNVSATGYSYTPPAKINPQNFNVPVNTTVDSSMMTKVSPSSLQDTYDEKQMALKNNTNPNLIPSDQYYSQAVTSPFQSLYNDVGNLSQYSPDEIQALQAKAQNDAKIYNTQLAARRQIKQLQEDGLATKEQAAAFISEAQRRADAQAADQAGLGSYLNASLDVLGKIRGNQLTAAQNQFSMLSPTQVSPGSTLYNPITGTQYQGTGASPATITSYAQTLKQNDQMTGNLHLTASGTVDDNYYYQQAQQAYATQGGTSGVANTNSSTSTNGTTQIPSQLQTYLQASGGNYINSDKVPANQQALVQQLAAQNGIPYLTGDEVSKMRSIDVTQSNLSQLQTVTSQILGSGLTGRTIGAVWNTISGALQLNPDISAFNAFRDTAINTIQALAGGTGSGLRLNQGEINTAVGNLPTITDNLETAQKKIALVSGFLDKWKSELLQGNQSGVEGSSGDVIQTKVGAVDNSWF